MGVKLEVPLVVQELSDECWYASACMVACYRAAGPRIGLPEQWRANNGINVPQFAALAAAEGLKSIMVPSSPFTPQQLEVLLRNNGPIWCAGFWDGVGHIVVLTGVEGQNVYINDPSPAKRKRVETLSWFNQKRDKFPNAMMFMPK